MADRAKFKRVFEKDIFENVRPVLPDASKYRGKGIPVINRASAGVTTDYQPVVVAGGHVGEYHGALQYLDRDGLDDPYLFAVLVCGASMEPALYDGDYVILSPLHPGRPHVQIHAGQVGLVRVGPGGKHPGNALARFAGQSGGVMRFTKDNPKFKGFEVEVENVEQLAVAVQRRTARV